MTATYTWWTWFHLVRQFSPRDPRKAWIVKPPDPLIHFALVCGSRSCAPIDYYDPTTIYDQFEAAARSFVNSSEVVVLPEEGKILLSEIFRWYESDFGGKRGVLDFLCDYLADDRALRAISNKAEAFRFEYIYYDWNLNRCTGDVLRSHFKTSDRVRGQGGADDAAYT